MDSKRVGFIIYHFLVKAIDTQLDLFSKNKKERTPYI